MRLNRKDFFLSLKIFCLISIIVLIFANVNLRVVSTRAGVADEFKRVFNFRFALNNHTQATEDLTKLHNVIIRQVKLENNLIPTITINTNTPTSIQEFINITKQLPFIKFTTYRDSEINQLTRQINLAEGGLIICLAASLTFMIFLLKKYIVSPILNNPPSTAADSHLAVKSNKSSHLKLYRADIDGLRALAVFLVILFHLSPLSLPGGFVGVDVFLVISGFVITQVIYQEMINGTFSFKLFFARRIKRILPTLYLMLFIVGIIGVLIFPRGSDTATLSESIKANIFYYYNFYIQNFQHNYFDFSRDKPVLLHTWSLAVEAQFYILFPFVLFFLTKKFSFKQIALLLSLIAISSFGYSIFFTLFESKYAYYHLFARIFEFLLGSLLAILNFQVISGITKLEMDKVHNKAKWISIAGLSLIVFSAVKFNKECAYPGYLSLVPALGASLFIMAGCINPRNLLNRLFSTRGLVFIGLISYSLYIWHWPVISLYYYENPLQEVSLNNSLLLLMPIFLIAVLNYYCVEKGIKRLLLDYRSTVIYCCIIPACLVLFTGIILNSFTLAKSQQIIMEEQMPDNYCVDKTFGDCVFGSSQIRKKASILLFGDSHATAFGSFIDELAVKNKFNLVIHTYFGCPPIASFEQYATDNCAQASKQFLAESNKYDTIILTGNFAAYLSQTFIVQFDKTINYLKDHHKKVIVIGDVPQYAAGSVEYIKRRKILKDLFNIDYDLSQVDLTRQNGQANQLIKNLAIKSKVYYFDFESLVSRSVKKYPFYDNYLLYYDYQHLNPFGSRLLARHIENTPVETELIQQILGL